MGAASCLHGAGIWGLGPRARAGPRLPHVCGSPGGLGSGGFSCGKRGFRGLWMGPGSQGAGRGWAETRTERSHPHHSPALLSLAPAPRTRGVGATRSDIGPTQSSEPSRTGGWGPRCPDSQEWCLGGDETHTWAQRPGQHVVPELRSSCHQGPEKTGQEDTVPPSLSYSRSTHSASVCARAELTFWGSETEGCVRIPRRRRGGRPTDRGLPPWRPPSPAC